MLLLRQLQALPGLNSTSTSTYMPPIIQPVKFGVPLDEVCKNDIPGPLLVLILKLNKEAPFKKDVFRAPGHQGNMKKLVHFLQNGRLVNMDNFSVYTIASVLKKFLRKLPGGIFGRDGEQLITSLPEHTQRLLVLLFGTFRVIATHAGRAQTGMSSEALGVSVAPSFFQSCVSDGKQARMEDVLRFKDCFSFLFVHFPLSGGSVSKYLVSFVLCVTSTPTVSLHVSFPPSPDMIAALTVSVVTPQHYDREKPHTRLVSLVVATRIMQFLIDNFGVSNLFGRHNYEFYARITGRILKVEEDWIFSFRYPPDTLVSRQLSLEAEKTWLQCECERWGLNFNLEAMSQQEESQSTPALIHVPDVASLAGEGPSSGVGGTSGLGIIPENNLLQSYTRLSISLEENGLFKVTSDFGTAHFLLYKPPPPLSVA
ncbi:hypothetical protein B566_EDAN010128 [Ephemera danica]|nr:hypothetical protein B566_EDAN010128 [Ephemera danica]